MANEPIYNVIKSETVKKIGSNQLVVEARLFPEGAEAAKVLAVNANCCITSVETVNAEARFYGKAVFKVLYMSTDGKYGSCEYAAEFND
ncbi:MAG: hypothetical protein FWE62_05090, partial [Firmicutes bacterium]|nr:hypothetical protein [Bacillota bacterium]